MRITEIYASVPGETQYAGLPCTLVRTTGCDLRWTYDARGVSASGSSKTEVTEDRQSG